MNEAEARAKKAQEEADLAEFNQMNLDNNIKPDSNSKPSDEASADSGSLAPRKTTSLERLSSKPKQMNMSSARAAVEKAVKQEGNTYTSSKCIIKSLFVHDINHVNAKKND